MAPGTNSKKPTASIAGHAGLSGMALYLPPYRVDLQQWCEWTGSDWQKIRKVVGSGFRLLGPQHSVYTMAANALLRLIRQYDIDPSRIRYLALGTESSTDNSAGAIIVKGMVDDALRGLGLPPIARNCEVPEFKHACLAGIYALKGAVRFLNNDGDDDGVAIVVCTDKALYERGSSGEPTQGAGAVAMLLEPQPRLAAINLRHAGTASEYRGHRFPQTTYGTAAMAMPIAWTSPSTTVAIRPTAMWTKCAVHSTTSTRAGSWNRPPTCAASRRYSCTDPTRGCRKRAWALPTCLPWRRAM